MCGIYGHVKKMKGKLRVSPRLQSLYNRGPDGVAFFEDEHVIFGHSRLAVIDEKVTSDQPIVGPELVLVCNGEIYNYKEIRELGGYSYTGTSDCEAILHVYTLFGVSGFERLSGFYAFVLYDKKKGLVFFHKDPVGKKPLFFHEGSSGFLGASNSTTIIDNLGEKPDLNTEAIYYYMKHGYVHPAKTVYKNIFPVLPGEVREIDVKTHTLKCYHVSKKVPELPLCQFPQDVKKVEDEIDRLLRRAVDQRIRELVHPTLLFSGGIDSTVLAGYMRDQHEKTTFISVKQPLRFLNDEPYVRYAAKLMKVDVHFVSIFTRQFAYDVSEYIRHLDSPLAVPSYYFISALALQAKKYGKVVFTGDGSDELFFGYDSLRAWFADTLNGTHESEVRVGPPPTPPLSEYGARAISTGLLGCDFVRLDKATAEHQMEARCPYLDWELMAYVRSLPKEFWLLRDETKWPLKNVLRRRGFPESFITRKKIGFSFPFRYLMVSRYSEMRSVVAKHWDWLSHHVSENVPKRVSLYDLYRRFDYYWRLFVLVSFLKDKNYA